MGSMEAKRIVALEKRVAEQERLINSIVNFMDAEKEPAKTSPKEVISEAKARVAEIEADVAKVVETILEIVGKDNIDQNALVRGVRKSMNIFYGRRKLSDETQNVWDGLEAEERQKNANIRKAIGHSVHDISLLIEYIDKATARGFSLTYLRSHLSATAAELSKLTSDN